MLMSGYSNLQDNRALKFVKKIMVNKSDVGWLKQCCILFSAWFIKP